MQAFKCLPCMQPSHNLYRDSSSDLHCMAESASCRGSGQWGGHWCAASVETACKLLDVIFNAILTSLRCSAAFAPPLHVYLLQTSATQAACALHEPAIWRDCRHVGAGSVSSALRTGHSGLSLGVDVTVLGAHPGHVPGGQAAPQHDKQRQRDAFPVALRTCGQARWYIENDLQSKPDSVVKSSCAHGGVRRAVSATSSTRQHLGSWHCALHGVPTPRVCAHSCDAAGACGTHHE